MNEDHEEIDLKNPKLWVKPYIPLLYDKHRRKVIYGSRDSAKSYFAAQKVLFRMLDGTRRTKGIMVRKAYNSIKESQFETFKDIVKAYRMTDLFTFHVSPLEIKCHNGARLIAKGLDRSGKAKSVKDPNLIWYEEADELSLDDFMQTTLSLRGGDLEEVLVFNAPTEGHWLLDRFFLHGSEPQRFEKADGLFLKVPSKDPSAIIMHTCYKHNQFCTPDRVREHEWNRDNMPEYYRKDGLGLISPKRTGFPWSRYFNTQIHVKPLQYDPALPVHLTFDQNRLPYSTCLAIQLQETEDGILNINMYREYCLRPPDNSTEHICEQFTMDHGSDVSGLFFYGDPSGKSESQRKGKDEVQSHYAAIERFLSHYITRRSNRVSRAAPSIAGRRYFMDLLLKQGMYLRLNIDPSCVNMIHDFQTLVEDENGGYLKVRVKDKETGQSYEDGAHCLDALVYFLYQCFPKMYDKNSKMK